MSILRSTMRTPFYRLTIFLLACVVLSGCDMAPSASTVPTQTSATESTHVRRMPTIGRTLTLVKLRAHAGWTELFQQKGAVKNGLTTRRVIGAFTTSKHLAIWTSCLGPGSFEISLRSDTGSKMPCTSAGATADVNQDTSLAPTTSTHYLITVTITGPVQWEILIEMQD